MIPGKTYVRKKKKLKKIVHRPKMSQFAKKRCEKYDIGACFKGKQCERSHSYVPDIAKVPLYIFIVENM